MTQQKLHQIHYLKCFGKQAEIESIKVKRWYSLTVRLICLFICLLFIF